ncbi:hypothetical protein BDZ90DRAFT_234549 [Jaminaea rosea]|uniref:Secreted protein n=1 Tax=Jaminaea rosea TaxID=1569628 RepID=A0A316UI22_9BASI|nr:hypothetical protein BDZ90DRAFT_234549 [Jaminaea rosea]PWN24946.1 hypothetical protein BDZ90DRAFT_234549 [Jaminaea rosea]
MRFLVVLAVIMTLATTALSLVLPLESDMNPLDIDNYPADIAPVLPRDSSDPNGPHESMDPTTGDDPTGFPGDGQTSEKKAPSKSNGQHKNSGRGGRQSNKKGNKKSSQGSRRNCEEQLD